MWVLERVLISSLSLGGSWRLTLIHHPPQLYVSASYLARVIPRESLHTMHTDFQRLMWNPLWSIFTEKISPSSHLPSICKPGFVASCLSWHHTAQAMPGQKQIWEILLMINTSLCFYFFKTFKTSLFILIPKDLLLVFNRPQFISNYPGPHCKPDITVKSLFSLDTNLGTEFHSSFLFQSPKFIHSTWKNTCFP